MPTPCTTVGIECGCAVCPVLDSSIVLFSLPVISSVPHVQDMWDQADAFCACCLRVLAALAALGSGPLIEETADLNTLILIPLDDVLRVFKGV